MSPTTIHEAITWIQDCPRPGPHQQLMVRVLSRNQSEFENRNFQFTVSMYMSLNVILDDGYYGIDEPDIENNKWFSLGPLEDGLVLRTGLGSNISDTTHGSESDAAALIRGGINYLDE